LENRDCTACIAKFKFAHEALIVLPVVNKFVSSAYKTTAAPGIYWGRSLMNNENNIGPKMDPCGTPILV
jgi:hypothetical protein